MSSWVWVLPVCVGAIVSAGCDVHQQTRRIVVPVTPDLGGLASNRQCIDDCLTVRKDDAERAARCLEQCPGAWVDRDQECSEPVPDETGCYDG